MKVLLEQPIRFQTGGLVDPDEINKVFLYGADALEDVSERRWQRTAVVLPFHQDCANGYTQALDAGVLQYTFVAPWDCVVERAFLSGNITTGSTTPLVVEVTRSSTGLVPDGCTTPFLSVGPVGAAAMDVFDRSAGSFRMVAGDSYVFSIKPSPTFSTNRLDLTLHLAVDRWHSVSMPSFDPALLTDANTADPAIVSSNSSLLVVEAAKFSNARGLSPQVVVRHTFSSTTNASALQFPLPRMRTARAYQRIVRIDFQVTMATTAGTTVTCTLNSQSGSVLATCTANVAGVTTASATTGAIGVLVDSSSVGITSTPTLDYSVRFAAGSTVVVSKAYATVWTECR